MKNISYKKGHSLKRSKVFVGLSGGVDSAVSAALLKERGFDVTGVFIKAWQPLDSVFGSAEATPDRQGRPKYPCTWREDRRSAMRAAAILDIPFITLNSEKEYKKEVVDYMINEYKCGRTPNPDVMCNKEIKFGHFLKFALDNGADFVATGHYARSELRGMNYELLEGEDKDKDQSYFLWTLTQEQLKHVLFPVGHLQKPEVRKLAGKFGLPQETRKDSQGLCFLGKIDMKEFLSGYIPQKRGDVLNEKGKIIGYHNGALFFTIGERHGFTLIEKTPNNEPSYVVAKDIEANTITVAYKHLKRSSKMLTKEVMLEETNFLRELTNKNISCRIRYRQEKTPCKISGNRVIFDRPQFGVSPGQSLVLYDDEICLGGGIIA